MRKKARKVKIAVLDEMREMYSAFGQMMQVLGRAMESEKDQL